MGKLIRNGIEFSGSVDEASSISYNNNDSGLVATNVQDAIDELSAPLYVQDIPSKNLLPNTASTTTSNGVTFTVNNDGSVSCSGISTGNALLFVAGTNWDIKAPFPFVGGQQYILSGCPSGGASNSYRIAIWEYYGSTNDHFDDVGNGVTFTANASANEMIVVITIPAGINSTGMVFYPMIRLASIADSSYVPYAKTNVELSKIKMATITLPWGNVMNFVKSGNIVQGTLQGQVPSQIPEATTSDNAIPSEFRPLTATELIMVYGNTPSTYLGSMVINTDGSIYNRVVIPALAYLRGSATWIIA